MFIAGWVVAVALAAATDIAPPPSGTWVVDQTGQVTAETRAAVDALADEVNAAGLAQVGVLVTDVVQGDGTPREFATAVFNHWGIGRRGVNDGILVMIAVQSRKAEIVLGSGRPLDTADTDDVMSRVLVPAMRSGDVNGAVLATVRALREELLARVVDASLQSFLDDGFPVRGGVCDLADRLSDEEEAALRCDDGACAVLVVDSTGQRPTIARLAVALRDQVGAASVLAVDVGQRRSFVAFARAPATTTDSNVVSVTGDVLTEAPLSRALPWARDVALAVQRDGFSSARVDRLLGAERPWSRSSWGSLAFLAFLPGFAFVLVRVLRERPRVCGQCKGPRRRLLKDEQLPHLSPLQRAEVAAGTAGFAVWRCDSCRDDEVVAYAANRRDIKACPKCAARTLALTPESRRALEGAGLVSLTSLCAHCGFSETWTEKAWDARQVWPNDLSQMGSSSSDSSSSSDFGGGSSDGGGSSGSW